MLQRELRGVGGRLFLEFVIPRMGKRADAVLVHAGTVFVIEFKVGADSYERSAVDQCVDYALDLKNFHEGSHRAPIAPVLVATRSESRAAGPYPKHEGGVLLPVKTNELGLGEAIECIAKEHPAEEIEPAEWEKSSYEPTPTIIEAALAMYAGHDLKDIYSILD